MGAQAYTGVGLLMHLFSRAKANGTIPGRMSTRRLV